MMHHPKESTTQKVSYRISVASLLALIVLCVVWEMWAAPLRPGGSWMALKALPLLFPLRGILKRDVYTLQWSSMFILLYFTEGVVRAASVSGFDVGLSAWLAGGEVLLACVFFISTLLFLRPYKQNAKRMARAAIDKAAGQANKQSAK
jgi:uncharacterized membrane protein